MKKNFDPKIIKNDFPIFKRTINGYPLVYLDNAATTQKPQSVINSLISYYQDSNANVFRGVHTLSVEATDLYDQARQKVQRFIKAKDIEEIIYTRNTSESINLVAYSWALKNLNKGDKIFTSKNISIKRPGIGKSPMMWYKIIGTKSKKNYKPDDPI